MYFLQLFDKRNIHEICIDQNVNDVIQNAFLIFDIDQSINKCVNMFPLVAIKSSQQTNAISLQCDT